MISIDPLYCQEEHLDFLDHHREENEEKEASIADDEEERETNLHLLSSLSHKETETNPKAQTSCSLGYFFSGARRDMVAWVACAVLTHGFTTQTALLSVNYLDRCFISGVLQLQPDKPWMGRLVAVACLSLAAKIEETQVPLILDLQLPVTGEEDTGTNGCAGFLFEAKTVRRMELLVLSALQWRLNSVTALSFVQPLVSLLYSEKRGDYLTARCERILLSVLDDWRWVKYAPSVWATAALLHALELNDTERIISLIKVSKEKAQECYDLILEGITASNRKRKHFVCKFCPESPPASPNAVINTCFSCENSSSSSDSFRSWSSSTTSSVDRPMKRTHYSNSSSSTADYSSSSLLREEDSRQAWELQLLPLQNFVKKN